MWTTKDIPNQKGRTVIVTGGNTGIGFETAFALFQAGANVIIACRDKDKAEKAIIKIENRRGAGCLEVGILDLASLNSIRQFAEKFIDKHQQLHLLINNAGVASPPHSKTSEGYELQFGVNFLGHFALTGLLYPLLQSTQGSRIVTLSSNGYQNAVIDFDNLKSEKDYNPLREYRKSKLANLIFSIELDRKIKGKGHQVLSIAAQPGANNTELTRHLSDEEIAIGKQRLGDFMEPCQGALSSLFAAVSDEATGGNMYEPDNGGLRGYPTLATIQGNAMDEMVGKKLWDTAQAITGIAYP
ncbi:MAG: oxidoreductase [Bacteroidota bacterium]|nr:oxidoreductase [Bacteroidota bacterium]